MDVLLSLAMDIEVFLLQRLFPDPSDLVFELVHGDGVGEDQSGLSFLDPLRFECDREISH